MRSPFFYASKWLTFLIVVFGWTLSRDRVFPALPPPPDCALADLPCLLASCADEQHRVVLTVASGGMIDFSENLLASLSAVGAAGRLLVTALDARAAAHLIARGAVVYWPGPPLGGGVGGYFSPESFGSAAYAATTKTKNSLVAAVLDAGYDVLFTDADTVWLQDPLAGSAPLLSPACNALRLGDTTSPLADGAPPAGEAAARGGCSGATLDVDFIGTYGDIGGMDTAFFYARSTPRARAHMQRVVALQATPEAALLPSDQEAFNALLQPWLPSHLADPSGFSDIAESPALLLPWLRAREAGSVLGIAPASSPLPYVAADVPSAVDAVQGFGPDRVRVAFFDPLVVPSGCRYDHARSAGTDIAFVHANCRTGWLAKAAFLYSRGLWVVRFWHDGHVRALAAIFAIMHAISAAGLCSRNLVWRLAAAALPLHCPQVALAHLGTRARR